MWQLLPPTALLLAVSTGQLSAGHPKAVLSLDPPWYRVLEKDSVTLRCRGTDQPEDNPVHWWHNESLISNQSSSYIIDDVSIKDSGDYKCQTRLTKPSDPVLLEVHAGWLVLQAVRRVFLVGQDIQLRCHTWKNKPLRKVSYFQDGRAQQFTNQNRNFSILNASRRHNGSYFCRGLIGSKRNESSESLIILVQDVSIPGHRIAFFLLIGLLFAVDTGLYFFIQRNLRSLKGDWRNHKVKWKQGSQDKMTPQAIEV